MDQFNSRFHQVFPGKIQSGHRAHKTQQRHILDGLLEHHLDQVPRMSEPNRTRAEEQRHINTLRVEGKIEQEEWRKRTDELSDCARWVASGRVQSKNPKTP
jgi:hypothetical protein